MQYLLETIVLYANRSGIRLSYGAPKSALLSSLSAAGRDTTPDDCPSTIVDPPYDVGYPKRTAFPAQASQ